MCTEEALADTADTKDSETQNQSENDLQEKAPAEQATQDKDANKKSTLKLDERTLLFHQEYVLSWQPLTMTLPWQRPVDTYCLNYRFLYSSEQYRPPIV